MLLNSTFGNGGLTDTQASAFGLTMLATDDLSAGVDLPFGGVYRHAWCGNAGQFRQSSLAADAIASQCVRLLGMSDGESTLSELMRSFFGNSKISSESAVFVLLGRGHISRNVAFKSKKVSVHVSSPESSMKLVGTPRPRKIALGFDQVSSDYSTILNFRPWSFVTPEANPDAVLWSRCRYRRYASEDGTDKGTDFILQLSPANEGGAEPKSLERGGYFPNTAPLRQPYQKYGYTDLSTLHFVRAIHRPFGPPKVHEIVLDVNAGLRRGDHGSLANNPDELLSVLTLNRRLERFLDDYSGIVEMLATKVS